MTTQSYDPAGNLWLIVNQGSSSLVNELAYTYDKSNHRITQSEDDGTITTWTYDPAYQLTYEERAGGPEGTSYVLTHVYDPAGNQTAQGDDVTATLYTYSPANRLISANAAGETTAYTYDAAGNRTSESGPDSYSDYVWDPAGRMVVAEVESGTITFTYDADGKRTAKQGTDGSAVGFLYDGKRLLHETDDVGGEITNTYAAGTNDEYGDLIGGGSEPTHQYDALSNTAALLDDSGQPEAKYKYTAFGEVQSVSIEGGPWSREDWDGLPPELNTHMLAGGRKQYYLDPETELYLLGSGNSDQGGRYYDPATARFVSEDPIRQAQGEANLFPYVNNDPVNKLDPSGHDSDDDQRKRQQQQAQQQKPTQAGQAGPQPAAQPAAHPVTVNHTDQNWTPKTLDATTPRHGFAAENRRPNKRHQHPQPTKNVQTPGPVAGHDRPPQLPPQAQKWAQWYHERHPHASAAEIVDFVRMNSFNIGEESIAHAWGAARQQALRQAIKRVSESHRRHPQSLLPEQSIGQKIGQMGDDPRPGAPVAPETTLAGMSAQHGPAPSEEAIGRAFEGPESTPAQDLAHMHSAGNWGLGPSAGNDLNQRIAARMLPPATRGAGWDNLSMNVVSISGEGSTYTSGALQGRNPPPNMDPRERQRLIKALTLPLPPASAIKQAQEMQQAVDEEHAQERANEATRLVLQEGYNPGMQYYHASAGENRIVGGANTLASVGAAAAALPTALTPAGFVAEVFLVDQAITGFRQAISGKVEQSGGSHDIQAIMQHTGLETDPGAARQKADFIYNVVGLAANLKNAWELAHPSGLPELPPVRSGQTGITVPGDAPAPTAPEPTSAPKPQQVEPPMATPKSAGEPSGAKGTGDGATAAPPKIDPEAMSQVTSHPDAHSLERHGGSVTDSQLETRARTGIAPDGSVKTKPNGKPIIPQYSTAFHSDGALIKADQAVRAGPLDAAIKADPSKTVIKVQGFDVGFDAGRGYSRIGSSSGSNLQGPLLKLDKLTKVTAVYEKNAATGKWQTITIYPEP